MSKQLSYVDLWLKQATVSPDRRGGVLLVLRRFRGFPGHFPNRAFMFKYILNNCKKLDPSFLDDDVMGKLWREYYDFYLRFKGGGDRL